MGVENHEGFVVYAQHQARYKFINETIAPGNSRVQQFYDGAVVFITGSSGFLGKQLIEKLFRSCKVKKVYCLLRTNQIKSPQQRLQEILKDPLYEYLHKNQPDFMSKIVPVEGDITKLQFDIHPKMWDNITEEVNVIIHGAATVNFNETLKVATLTNVRAVRELIGLAKACKNLRSMVHISTAYVQATEDRCDDWVMEKFYDPPMTPELLIRLAEEFDVEKMNELTPQIISKWPNTYTFTKSLAEELIRKMAADLPVCVVRPAIVIGAIQEPPGWMDTSCINGPVGFMLGACVGGLHSLLGDKEKVLDLVPVDFVNNAILVSAQETAARRENGENEIKIYTITCTRKPIIFSDIETFCLTSGREIPTPKVIWHGYLIFTKNIYLFTLLSWILQDIPAYIADKFLQLAGKKPIVLRLVKKAYKQSLVFSYFILNEWKYGDTNLLEMRNKLSPADRIIYEMDTSCYEQKAFLYMNLFGTRKYLLKDELKDTEWALKKLIYLKIANAVFMTVYAYVIWKMLSTMYNIFSVLV